MKRLILLVLTVMVVFFLFWSYVNAEDIFWKGAVGYLDFKDNTIVVMNEKPGIMPSYGEIFGEVKKETKIRIMNEGEEEISSLCRNMDRILSLLSGQKVQVIGSIHQTGEGEGTNNYAKETIILLMKE